MDKTFSLYRVGLLLKRQWASFGKIFLIALGAVTLMILGAYLFNLPRDGQFQYRVVNGNEIGFGFSPVALVTLSVLFISMSSSWYFSKWGKKANAIEDLLLPASSLEKFVCSFLLTGIVCIGSFYIVFLLVDSGYRAYMQRFVNSLPGLVPIEEGGGVNSLIPLKYKDVSIASFWSEVGGRNLYTVLILQFLLQCVFLLGSIYFKRFQYIKTLISFLVFTFLVFSASIRMIIVLTRHKIRVFHTLSDLEQQRGLWIPSFHYALTIITIIVCYWATYQRIKEKEI